MKIIKTIAIILIMILCLTVLSVAFIHKDSRDNNKNPSINTTTNTTINTETATVATNPNNTQPEQDIVEYYNIDNNKKYVGVYANEPQELLAFEDYISVLGWFDTFEKPSITKISMCLDQHQYIAFITLEPENMDLKQIVEGNYDDKIISYLKLLSDDDRVNTELFIRFAHEMEMRPTYGYSWYTWQGYDSEAYVNAWRHVVNLGKIYAPNVKWVWSPNRADLYTEAYYPGNDYVDYVGLTLNNLLDYYDTFESFYVKEGRMEYLEAYNKPIIFGEVAEHCLDENQKNNYISSIFEYVKNYDKAIGIVLLNKDVNEERQYKFSDNETQMNTFLEKASEFKYYGKQD